MRWVAQHRKTRIFIHRVPLFALGTSACQSIRERKNSSDAAFSVYEAPEPDYGNHVRTLTLHVSDPKLDLASTTVTQVTAYTQSPDIQLMHVLPLQVEEKVEEHGYTYALIIKVERSIQKDIELAISTPNHTQPYTLTVDRIPPHILTEQGFAIRVDSNTQKTLIVDPRQLFPAAEWEDLYRHGTFSARNQNQHQDTLLDVLVDEDSLRIAPYAAQGQLEDTVLLTIRDRGRNQKHISLVATVDGVENEPVVISAIDFLTDADTGAIQVLVLMQDRSGVALGSVNSDDFTVHATTRKDAVVVSGQLSSLTYSTPTVGNRAPTPTIPAFHSVVLKLLVTFTYENTSLERCEIAALEVGVAANNNIRDLHGAGPAQLQEPLQHVYRHTLPAVLSLSAANDVVLSSSFAPVRYYQMQSSVDGNRVAVFQDIYVGQSQREMMPNPPVTVRLDYDATATVTLYPVPSLLDAQRPDIILFESRGANIWIYFGWSHRLLAETDFSQRGYALSGFTRTAMPDNIFPSDVRLFIGDFEGYGHQSLLITFMNPPALAAERHWIGTVLLGKPERLFPETIQAEPSAGSINIFAPSSTISIDTMQAVSAGSAGRMLFLSRFSTQIATAEAFGFAPFVGIDPEITIGTGTVITTPAGSIHFAAELFVAHTVATYAHEGAFTLLFLEPEALVSALTAPNRLESLDLEHWPYIRKTITITAATPLSYAQANTYILNSPDTNGDNIADLYMIFQQNPGQQNPGQQNSGHPEPQDVILLLFGTRTLTELPETIDLTTAQDTPVPFATMARRVTLPAEISIVGAQVDTDVDDDNFADCILTVYDHTLGQHQVLILFGGSDGYFASAAAPDAGYDVTIDYLLF